MSSREQVERDAENEAVRRIEAASKETKVELAEYPVAYVAQLKSNCQETGRRFQQVKEELEILRECCWCILSSVADKDDRKFLKETLKGEAND